MRILQAGALYFLVVFGAGFVLGTIRVLWVVARFGERTAELMESPIMMAVTIVTARWTVRRFRIAPIVVRRLAMGLFALGLLLAAELCAVLFVRQLTLAEYFASRDPLSGAVYLALLGLFAAMPAFVERR